MQVEIRGLGVWGEGFGSWQDLLALMAGEPVASPPTAPKPAVIPANERRRAPLAVRMAVEVCSQAVAAAKLDPTELACVFASGLGDTDLTDYMCRELAGELKQLSPTKFHNSVHNAAAGYWTIATGCRQPANSVAGLDQSVSVALMEGICQCLAEQQPVILAFYDIPTCTVLADLFANRQAFAAALVIAPTVDATDAALLNCEVSADNTPRWPELALPAELAECYAHNPAARVLPLLLAATGGQPAELSLPLSAGASLHCRVTPADNHATGKSR